MTTITRTDAIDINSATPSVPAAPRNSRTYPKPIWSAIVFSRFMRGYMSFLRTGVTPEYAYTDMRRLFRMSNGRFNDAVARVHSLLHPARSLASPCGVLGDLDGAGLPAIISPLRRDGFHRFDTPLPASLCNRLRDFALDAPCQVVPSPSSGGPFHRFDPDRIIGTRYQVERQALHENHDVQRLLIDPSIISVAAGYLNCMPVCIGCELWWSAAFAAKADAAAAQLYHFDMSQIKFLKIFAYLTDVDVANGPHSFVLGSHRRAPRHMLVDRRYGDDEIQRVYPRERILTVAGPAGSVFAEDTRGFHKGTPLQHGHRLILQFLYATSGFGETLEPVRVNDRFLPEFVERTRGLPRLFGHGFKEASA